MRYAAVKFKKMAELDEAEVHYCSEHLNVRKEANENELRAAYKRMCMIVVSSGQTSRSREEESKVKKVLSNPETRSILHFLWTEGPGCWEVIEIQRTPVEVVCYRSLKNRESPKRKEECWLQQVTDPMASISVGMDATNLFDADNVKILLKEVINCIGGIAIRSHGEGMSVRMNS